MSDGSSRRRVFVDHDAAPVLSDLAVGTAGEHLVCADLLLQGHRAFLADQNCSYDVVVEVKGRLLRVQVKTTLCARAIPQRTRGYFPAYMWNVRRAGVGGARRYGKSDFDLLALVALDCRRIAYMLPSFALQTIHIRTHDDPGSRGPSGWGKRGKIFPMFPFSKVLQEFL